MQPKQPYNEMNSKGMGDANVGRLEVCLQNGGAS